MDRLRLRERVRGLDRRAVVALLEGLIANMPDPEILRSQAGHVDEETADVLLAMAEDVEEAVERIERWTR